MLAQFKTHITETFDFDSKSPILLACSGGCDSVVLGHLLVELGYSIIVVHVNFQLRGNDSEQDALFVAALAQSWSVPFYTKRVDVAQYRQAHGCSLQMAARDLRYAYFEHVRAQFNLQSIVVAHHADDDHETFLINLSRGTGLSGLSGMSAQNGYLCRPLLPFTRQEIEQWANDQNITWRDDVSNDSDHYERNFIRHHVSQGLKQMKRPWLKTFRTTQNNLKQSQNLINDYLSLVQHHVLTQNDHETVLDLEMLQTYRHPLDLLAALLKPYGFTAWNDLSELTTAETGKYIDTPTHHIQKDRNTLVIMELTRPNEPERPVWINEGVRGVDGPVSLCIAAAQHWQKPMRHELYVDADLLIFPLCLRPWKIDDIFHPFGLKGKKKLSKYFKDEKLSLASKNRIWVLESNGDIIWVVGHRADDRFKITDQTTNILHFMML
jgi:tRNA(Ile)-lysidine synthase